MAGLVDSTVQAYYCGVCKCESSDRKKRKLLMSKAGEVYHNIILKFVHDLEDWTPEEVEDHLASLPLV